MMKFGRKWALVAAVVGFSFSAIAVERDGQTAAILLEILRESFALVSPAQWERRVAVSKLAEQVGALEAELFSRRERLGSLQAVLGKLPSGPERERTHIIFFEERNRVDGLVSRLAYAESSLEKASEALDQLPPEQSPLEREALRELEAVRQGKITIRELMQILGARFAAATHELNVLVDPPVRPHNVVVRELVVTVLAALQMAYAQDEDLAKLRGALPLKRFSRFAPMEAALYVAMGALGWHSGVLLEHPSLPPESVALIFGAVTTLRGSVGGKWPIRSREQAQARAALEIFLREAVPAAEREDVPKRRGLERQMRVVTDYVLRTVRRYGVAPCAELLTARVFDS